MLINIRVSPYHIPPHQIHPKVDSMCLLSQPCPCPCPCPCSLEKGSSRFWCLLSQPCPCPCPCSLEKGYSWFWIVGTWLLFSLVWAEGCLYRMMWTCDWPYLTVLGQLWLH